MGKKIVDGALTSGKRGVNDSDGTLISWFGEEMAESIHNISNWKEEDLTKGKLKETQKKTHYEKNEEKKGKTGFLPAGAVIDIVFRHQTFLPPSKY